MGPPPWGQNPRTPLLGRLLRGSPTVHPHSCLSRVVSRGSGSELCRVPLPGSQPRSRAATEPRWRTKAARGARPGWRASPRQEATAAVARAGARIPPKRPEPAGRRHPRLRPRPSPSKVTLDYPELPLPSMESSGRGWRATLSPAR